MEYYLNEEIKGNLNDFINRANAKLGRQAVLAVGSDGLITATNLTNQELESLKEVAHHLDVLDGLDASNIRNLTLAQARQAVTNITDLTDAKAVLDKMVIVLWWLLKREMGQV